MIQLAPRDMLPAAPPSLASRQGGSRQLYFAMLGERGGGAGRIDELTRSASRAFLAEKLRLARTIDAGFPGEARSLPRVLRDAHAETAQAYRRYLDERHEGAPRRFFGCRSHAMHFLRTVAPTKLVDGAWLYGLLQRWQDPRLAPLIQIYLEELGCGAAPQNHVLLYRQLLARYGCDQWQDGPDAHFTQGAVQLALAHNAGEFLPELIGFNLGYEQLPLHLPITAYELNELDIDPYYFTLHVTIDNASTGHARKALQSVLDCMPRIGDAAEFYRRVGIGYQLNLVGMGTQQAIASFDLERELLRVLVEKASIGAQLHSDYCRIGGRPVSDWLSSPGEVPALLKALQSAGWIRRGGSPEQSRFWHLLTDEQAPMFSVFDGYEQQLLRDWIEADAASTPTARTTNRFRRRLAAAPVAKLPPALQSGATVEQVIAHHAGGKPKHGGCAEVDALFEQLAQVNTKVQAFAVLGACSRRRNTRLRRALPPHGSMPISSTASLAMSDAALLRLALALETSGYAFTTVTPATHARVNARPANAFARNAQDVFGWSRPFREGVLPPHLFKAMRDAEVLEPHGEGWVTRVRASTLHGRLFLHSAYPTTASDAVFFGPDTYRFADAIARHLAGDVRVRRAVDVGCGAGPGAVVVALARPEAEVFAVDINDTALRYTAVNARLAGAGCVVARHSDLLDGVDGSFDLIVANPPYLLDAGERTYRHGGGNLGEGLSLAIAGLAGARLAPGGTLLLYTGTAIVEGKVHFRDAVAPLLDAAGLAWHCEELDPDVFGEELAEPAYADADRIAAVLLSARKAAA